MVIIGDKEQEPGGKAPAADAERIRQNYRYNYPYGIAQGLFYYAGMGFYSLSSIFAKLIYDLSGSNQIVGLMSTVMNAFFALSQLLGTAVIEHLREKKPPMLRYGFLHRLPWLLMGLALVMLPAAAALVAIIILYAICHFFNGIYILAFFDLMAKIIPLDKRGEYFGRRNSVSQVVQAAAGGLAGYMVGRYSYLGGAAYRSPLGFALCLWLAFAVQMVDLWLLAKLKEEPAATAGQKETLREKVRAVPRLLRSDGNFTRYCVLRSLMQLGFFCTPFFIGYAGQRVAITGFHLSVYTAANLLAWSAGTFLWGQLADRWGFKRIMEVCSILLAVVFCLTPWLGSFAAFVSFFVVSGFLTGGQVLSFDALLMEFGKPDNRPTYIATVTIVGGVTGAIGPILAGVIADNLSYVALFGLMAAVMAAAALASLRRVTDPRQVTEYWA